MPRPHFLATLMGQPAAPMRLGIQGRERPLATAIETAFDAATRRTGLLGRTSLAPDAALILAPCDAVHTFGMRFAIDVIFVARDGRVLKVRRALADARVTMARRAFATIEMAAGEADRHGLRAGDVLTVEPALMTPVIGARPAPP